MPVGQSAHFDDYVLLKPVFGNGTDQAPTEMELADDVDPTYGGAKFWQDPVTGDIWESPTSITYPDAPTDEPTERIEVTSTVSESNGWVYTTTLQHSNRTGGPLEWRTEITDDMGSPVVDLNWMNEGGGEPTNPTGQHSPTGNALQITDRAFENFGELPGVAQFSNPNMGGAGDAPQWPEGETGLDDPLVRTKCYTGLITYDAQFPQAEPISPNAKSIVCMQPLDFFAFPGGPLNGFPLQAYQEFGADSSIGEDRPPLWYLKRHFMGITLNHGQRARLHRVDVAWFDAREWNKTDYTTQSLVYWRSVNFQARNLTFDETYFVDLTDGTTTAVSGWEPPTSTETWNRRWQAMRHRQINYDNSLSASPWPDGYCGIALRRSSDDFCVCFIAKIEECDSSLGVDTTLEATAFSKGLLVHSRGLNSTNSTQSNSGVHVEFQMKTDVKSPSGWVVKSTYIYTGLYADLQDEITYIMGAGLLDEVVTTSLLPGAVVDEAAPTIPGTSFPGGDPLDPYPGDPQDPGDPPGGGTGGGTQNDLIPEDGTGLFNANSYTTVVFGDQYFAVQGGQADWDAADEETKEEALRFATQWIDLTYGQRFVGLRSRSTQALEVPRSLAWDRNGYPVEGVPIWLQKATCEAAIRWLADPTQFTPDEEAGTNVSSETKTVGPLSITRSYGSGKTLRSDFPIIDRMLRMAGLLSGGSWVQR